MQRDLAWSIIQWARSIRRRILGAGRCEDCMRASRLKRREGGFLPAFADAKG
jgi:hypothetical protein